ncbi:hypothetical protein V8C26DRAFT_416952 [Trichoderma gracile]
MALIRCRWLFMWLARILAVVSISWPVAKAPPDIYNLKLRAHLLAIPELGSRTPSQIKNISCASEACMASKPRVLAGTGQNVTCHNARKSGCVNGVCLDPSTSKAFRARVPG